MYVNILSIAVDDLWRQAREEDGKPPSQSVFDAMA
jgi:hypothetical protein